MDDELHDRLENLGADPGPAPDPAFAERLEADLRSQAYFAPRDRAHAAPARRGLLRPGLVMGALVVLALSAVLVVSRGGEEPDVLVIENGLGATVTLPGGDTVAGGSGVALPDGSLIEVAADGFALIDGIVLPPGSIATVVDGVLELTAVPAIVIPTPTPTPTPSPTPDLATTPEAEPTPASVADPTPTAEPTTPPEVAPSPTPSPTARPAPTAPPNPTTTASPRPTPSPEQDGTPRERPTATATPTATPEPTVVDPAPEIVLDQANLGPRRAQLTWSVTAPDGVLGFQVRVRRGDTVRTAAVLRDPEARALTVERPERDRVFYRVLAIGSDGQVLARSNEVRVTNPDG